jgi:hypothetical protein
MFGVSFTKEELAKLERIKSDPSWKPRTDQGKRSDLRSNQNWKQVRKVMKRRGMWDLKMFEEEKEA